MILRPLKVSASSLSSYYYYINKAAVCCYAEGNLRCFKGVYFRSVNILLIRQILTCSMFSDTFSGRSKTNEEQKPPGEEFFFFFFHKYNRLFRLIYRFWSFKVPKIKVCVENNYDCINCTTD